MPAACSAARSSRHSAVDVALAVGAPLVERSGDAPVLLGLEVAEGEILELPLQLPDAEAVGERGVDDACLDRAPLALGGAAARARAADPPAPPRAAPAPGAGRSPRRAASCAASPPGAHRGLAPATSRAAGRASPRRCSATAMSVAPWPTIIGGLLGREAAREITGPREQRVGELGALGESADDLGRLGREAEIRGRARAGTLERGTRADDGVADRGRAELSWFPWASGLGAAAPSGRATACPPRGL